MPSPADLLACSLSRLLAYSLTRLLTHSPTYLREQWAGVLSAMLLHSLRADQTWGQLLEDVRAHTRRSKTLVLPVLSSTAPLDLSAETLLV